MSASADKPGFLSVVPDRPIELRDVPRRIQITDGSLALVAKGFGSLEGVTLPSGIYQARVESTEQPFEHMLFLPPGGKVTVTYPLHKREVLPSAAPVPGADAMHEYFRGPLNEAVMWPPTRSSRILVMVTSNTAQIDCSNLRVLSAAGEPLGSRKVTAGGGSSSKWQILSHDVDQGGFVIEAPGTRCDANSRLRQPVWCSESWTTLIFLGVDTQSGIPDLDSASIYLWHTGTPFAPEISNLDDPITTNVMESQRYTELALHSLVQGRNLFSAQEAGERILRARDQMLGDKFRNPMLGILGGHLLLASTHQDVELLTTVLTNLDSLIPDHPDVIALKCLARQQGVSGLKIKAAVSWPPMLRRGFLALRTEDWRKPGALAEGSVCDRVRSRVLSGGVWTRWLAEKDRNEFAKPKVGSFAKLLSSTASPVLSYARTILAQPRSKAKADSLEWTGLSRKQASAIFKYAASQATSLARSRSGRPSTGNPRAAASVTKPAKASSAAGPRLKAAKKSGLRAASLKKASRRKAKR